MSSRIWAAGATAAATVAAVLVLGVVTTAQRRYERAFTLRMAATTAAYVAAVTPPPPPPPPPRANAIVGAARPTDATASNAITVLRNITILRQRFAPNHNRVCRWRSFQKIATGFDESITQLSESERE